MLFAIIADQRLADRLQRGIAPRVAIGGQHRRVTLPGYDRADDGHAGRTGDVGHHVMKLQVHLHQRLLHVLDVRGGIVQQSLALAQIGPHGCNLAFQPEAGSEQAVFMQPLQPLGVADIGLAARHVLGIARIDEDDFEASLVQYLKHRDPVDRWIPSRPCARRIP